MVQDFSIKRRNSNCPNTYRSTCQVQSGFFFFRDVSITNFIPQYYQESQNNSLFGVLCKENYYTALSRQCRGKIKNKLWPRFFLCRECILCSPFHSSSTSPSHQQHGAHQLVLLTLFFIYFFFIYIGFIIIFIRHLFQNLRNINMTVQY